MTTFEDIWRKLSKSKKYRESYALALLKRSVPFQIKTLRKKYFGSQAELGNAAGITQGVVSRAEDQDYGNLTLNTVGKIAGGFDVAFIGRFVPFSELVKFSVELSEEQFGTIPTFGEENAGLGLMPHFGGLVPIQQLGSVRGVEESSSPIDKFSKMPPRSTVGSDRDQSTRDERRMSEGGILGDETKGAAKGQAVGAA